METLGPYLLGPNNTIGQGIYNGDARVLARFIPDASVNLAVFDPPYGISWQSSRRTATERFQKITGDDEIETSWLKELYRILEPSGAAYIFTRWDVLGEWMTAIKQAGFELKNCIVWDKGFHGAGDLTGAYAPQHEMILFATKGRHILAQRKPDVIRTNRVNPSELVHPAQKPVALMNHLLDASSVRGAVVADFFCGSGTVQVACKASGRKFIGFEIDHKTAQLARDRVRNTQEPLMVVEQPKQLSLIAA